MVTPFSGAFIGGVGTIVLAGAAHRVLSSNLPKAKKKAKPKARKKSSKSRNTTKRKKSKAKKRTSMGSRRRSM